MPRKGLIAAALTVLLAVALYASTPPSLVNAAAAPVIPDDLDAYLVAGEREIASRFALIPETEKLVTWREPGVRTEYAVVSLHGFSATRQETAPLAARIADALDANLFETRLTGHGHGEEPMHEVRAEDWLDDAAEALAIGSRLGDKIIVIGSSTGGTLALAMSDRDDASAVTDIVLLSPNLQPHDPRSLWLTRPAGTLIARLLAGDTRSWTPHNELQGRYWSTSYPIDAVIEVMRLVDHVQGKLPMTMRQDLLVFLSPDDTVVSADAVRQAFVRIDAESKQLIEIPDVQDPSNHILAGDILSPDTTDMIAVTIVDFVSRR